MPDWTGKWFFFLVIAFLIFVISKGDGPKWKAIFTTSTPSPVAPSSVAATNIGNTMNALSGVGSLPGLPALGTPSMGFTY